MVRHCRQVLTWIIHFSFVHLQFYNLIRQSSYITPESKYSSPYCLNYGYHGTFTSSSAAAAAAAAVGDDRWVNKSMLLGDLPFFHHTVGWMKVKSFIWYTPDSNCHLFLTGYTGMMLCNILKDLNHVFNSC